MECCSTILRMYWVQCTLVATSAAAEVCEDHRQEPNQSLILAVDFINYEIYVE